MWMGCKRDDETICHSSPFFLTLCDCPHARACMLRDHGVEGPLPASHCVSARLSIVCTQLTHDPGSRGMGTSPAVEERVRRGEERDRSEGYHTLSLWPHLLIFHASYSIYPQLFFSLSCPQVACMAMHTHNPHLYEERKSISYDRKVFHGTYTISGCALPPVYVKKRWQKNNKMLCGRAKKSNCH